MAYDPESIENKWQDRWEQNGTFRVEMDRSKPKLYVLDMFPYPSGAGLHVGHPEGYTATDIFARFKRMQGFNVLHPMGWDSYGLPAERYAMRTGVHPAVTTKQNVATFRRQIKRLGFSYDWSREVATTDPEYIKWTQWIFIKLFERGLAYETEATVNWCPAQGTVLANEEVKDGRYVETGDPVERRLMRQWMLKITAYADRLLSDLEDLDWPEGVKAMQRNWIGRSEGAEISLPLENSAEHLVVFSTRPETLWGATYCVLAPEHPLLEQLHIPSTNAGDVHEYISQASRLSDIDRTDGARPKTGVATGLCVVNPANSERIPIWISDYVLTSYGTGAVMAVPAHDERDHEFAKQFRLPIRTVVEPPAAHNFESHAWVGDGRMVNSAFLNDLSVSAAKTQVIEWLERHGHGKRKVNYRLRDWLFSRQRYWGEPIPVLHLQDGRVVPVPEDSLPVLPPELDDYKPTADGRPPLARATEWVSTIHPKTGEPAARETNTMPQWAGSCWYYLRFIDPQNSSALVDPEKERYWMPVDLYIGGAEHAVLHLLYARFWHKVLYDIGVVSTNEPFQKLFNQGMILAHSYKDAAGKYYEPSAVQERDGSFFAGATEVHRQIEKMSKSRFNVVNPDDAIASHGADAVRLYEMFMGPLDVTKPWQTAGVAGVRRFLNRTWRLVCDEDDHLALKRLVSSEPDAALEMQLHRTIRAVTEDIDALRFNTAIARLMELVNVLTPMDRIPLRAVESLVLLLSPFAPHIAEELWEKLGHSTELAYAQWPLYEQGLTVEEQTEYAVQINGKLRHVVMAGPNLKGDELVSAVLADKRVASLLANQAVAKTFHVPGRLVNFVLRR